MVERLKESGIEMILKDAEKIIPQLAELTYPDRFTRRVTKNSNRSVSLIVLSIPHEHAYESRFRKHDISRRLPETEKDLILLTLAHLKAVNLEELAKIIYQRLNLSSLPEGEYSGYLFFPIKNLDDLKDLKFKSEFPEKGVYWYAGNIREQDMYKPLANYLNFHPIKSQKERIN